MLSYVQTPQWGAAVRDLTGGVHHVLELGGAGALAQSQIALGVGGHLALIGGLAGFGGELSAVGLVVGAQRASAIAVGSRAEHLAMCAFVAKHAITPQIERMFEVEAADAAYARADRGAFGKVLIKLA